MSARMLVLLGLGALVAIALTLLLVDRPPGDAARSDQQALIPGLQAHINEVDAIDIIGPDGEAVASLRRQRERWRLREKHGYEADFARVHALLRDLARAQRLEARSDNPQHYPRLGVAAPGSGEGSGTGVRFPGSQLAALIVGRRDPAGIGRYVRLQDEPRVWLTDQDPDLPLERLQWVERAIMDIPAGDIRSVSIRHPDGDVVELRPGDEQGSVWVLLDPPAGREVGPAWKLRQSADALARLNLEDVRPHDQAAVPADAVETVFATRDGMVFRARLFSDEHGYWVHFEVRGDAASAAAGDSEPGATDDAAAAGQQAAADADQLIDLVAVDARLSPWQFAISESRFQRLTAATDDLLAAPEGASD